MWELPASTRANGSIYTDNITNRPIISHVSIGNQNNPICDTAPAESGIFPVSAK